jgi:hypothetical protein
MVPAVPLVPAILHDLHRTAAIFPQAREDGRVICIAETDRAHAALVLETNEHAPGFQRFRIGLQWRVQDIRVEICRTQLS